jgi:hypothetical protein
MQPATPTWHWFRLMPYATEQDFWTLPLEKVMILARVAHPFLQGANMTLTHLRCTDCGCKDVKAQRTYTIKHGEQLLSTLVTPVAGRFHPPATHPWPI